MYCPAKKCRKIRINVRDMKNQKSKKVIKTPHILDSITGQTRVCKITTGSPHFTQFSLYMTFRKNKLLINKDGKK